VTAASRARFAEVVRSEPIDLALAAALISVEANPDVDVDACLDALDVLAGKAASIPGIRPEHKVRFAVGGWLGDADWLGNKVDWDDVRSSLLPEVIRRRRGLPILQCLLYVEVARRAGFAMSYGAVPGRVVVVVDERRVFDPYGNTFLRKLPGPLVPLTPHEVLLRLLTNIRALTERLPPSLDMARTRLWAVELSLLLPVHPADLRRQRGELLVRLGSYVEGAEELEAYADVVEDADDGVADTCRRSARHARARLN